MHTNPIICPKCHTRPVGAKSKTGMCRPCAVSAGKVGIDGRDGPGPNPSGLCMCGCGEPTPIARFNRSAKGEIAGKPKRFVAGHRPRFQSQEAARRIPPPNPSGLCQCGCGRPTRIAFQSSTEKGHVKGSPIPYLPGHNNSIRTWTVDDETGCWIWDGNKDRLGYTGKRFDGKQTGAHRWVYTQLVGPIPDGMSLDHLCRNPSCVNPAHLEPVTHTENIRRGAHTQITMEIANQIRDLRPTMSIREIATHLGVSRWIVEDVSRGKTWR